MIPPHCTSTPDRRRLGRIVISREEGDMTGMVEKKLAELGIKLPTPASPIATYVGFVQTGSFLFVSGQLCLADGRLVATGQLGVAVSIEDGQAAARACAINLLAQVKTALGNLTSWCAWCGSMASSIRLRTLLMGRRS
jgi:enamine deaminase RidA (YjgF/YER057c/UK114 family)